MENDYACERASQLLESGQYSDLQLTVAGESEQESGSLRVHKCILALTSCMWNSCLEWITGDTLEITGFSFQVIETTIKYAYTNKVKFDSFTHCYKVMAAADYYIMPGLIKQCEEYVCKAFRDGTVTLTNIVELLNCATLYNTASVKNVCYGFIEDNPTLWFESDDFLGLTLNHVVDFLDYDLYFCSEYLLMRAVLRWATRNFVPNENVNSLSLFLIECKLSDKVDISKLSCEEAGRLFEEFPSVFPLDYRDEIMAKKQACSSTHSRSIKTRGCLNEILPDKVIVNSPPMGVIEEFMYFGPPTLFKMSGISLECRTSSHHFPPGNSYEESFSIRVRDGEFNFSGVVQRGGDGPTAVSTVPLSMYLKDQDVIPFAITLNCAGVYNCNFNYTAYETGLTRMKRGIIQKIFSPE